MSSAGVMSENSCVNEEIADDIDGARLLKRHKFASRYKYKGTSGRKRADQARVARDDCRRTCRQFGLRTARSFTLTVTEP